MGETGVVLQRRRHRRDAGVDAGGEIQQRHARLGQGALALVHQRQHLAGTGHLAVPEHPVQPRGMVRGQQCAVRLEIVGLDAGAHRPCAPGHHQFGLGLALPSLADQRGGMAEHALGGLRRLAVIEGKHRLGPGPRHRRLALRAQPVEPRPVRAAGQEIDGLLGAAIAGAQHVPGDDVAPDRALDAGGAHGRGPGAAAQQLHALAQTLGGVGTGGRGQNEAQAECPGQNAGHHLQFPGNQG